MFFKSGFSKSNVAQSLMEYTIVISIITAVLVAMNTFLRRGVQGMVKLMADEIGNQQEAEQDFSEDAGHLESSDSFTKATSIKITEQALGNISYGYGERIETFSVMNSFLGATDPDE